MSAKKKSVGVPDGLRAKRFSIEGEEFAVLVLPPRSADAASAKLTAAEREVARLTLKGLTNEEIAAMRGSSTRTVANQLQAIYRKLGISSRVELSHRLGAEQPRPSDDPD
ncbi:MAG: helix-turn-helix transcriptional regulator [Polyangiaceae bacterium]|nr:helix-turn-helix transcriptional regulator [Polyangiaceae bacterium]